MHSHEMVTCKQQLGRRQHGKGEHVVTGSSIRDSRLARAGSSINTGRVGEW